MNMFPQTIFCLPWWLKTSMNYNAVNKALHFIFTNIMISELVIPKKERQGSQKPQIFVSLSRSASNLLSF